MEFKDRLKYLISLRSVKQKDIAKECYVSKATVTRWVKGLNIPNSKQLLLLSKFLNVSLDYLLGNTNEVTEDYREIIITSILHMDPFNQKRVYDFIKDINR